MRLFGFEITRAKSLSPPQSGKWINIHDINTGDWQMDKPADLNTVLSFSPVFACVRLITADIGKMRIRLMQQGANGIWVEAESPSFSPVLRKPNPYQTRIKFIEQWLASKLLHGNAYVLKVRDNREIVTQLRVLDPTRTDVLISDDGQVFYRLRQDRITGVNDAQIVIPATEIIHDVHVTPEHPLVGVSPITACALTSMQGISIQRNSERFFGNLSRPSIMLTAPGAISKDTAERIAKMWQEQYGGENLGKVAVAGDGLEAKTFSVPAADAQLIEQLKWTAEDVCRAFGVPGYKVGVGQFPSYNNLPALNQSYYDDTLQELIECIEVLLYEGLELPSRYRASLDIEQLLRMDTKTRYESYEKALGSGWKSVNEVRQKENQEAVQGGDTPYLQQQYWPLSQLSRRSIPEIDAVPNEDEVMGMERTFRKELFHGAA